MTTRAASIAVLRSRWNTALNTLSSGRVWKICHFGPVYGYVMETVQDVDVVIIEHWLEMCMGRKIQARQIDSNAIPILCFAR